MNLSTVLLLAALLAAAAGQGLESGEAQLGASSSPTGALAGIYAAADEQWSKTQAWKRTLKATPKSACVGTSRDSLCSSSGGAAQYAVLKMATSPAAYSSLDPRAAGPLRVISAPRNQEPCASCTAFTVATAAEAAVATTLSRDVRDVGRLSTQDLHYCGSQLRDCYAGASLKDALDQLKTRRLLLEECLPYRPDQRGKLSREEQCAKSCSDTSPLAAKGSFNYVPISQLWRAQEIIREKGAVVTRFNIYSDFRPFFEDPSNKNKVYRVNTTKLEVEEQHAIVLVGYDNEKKFWIARNSWGPEFADQGNFRVSPIGAPTVHRGL
ncbi:MAG: hypothetical protein J3K34DRAFT_83333 [Monoraphidium minutum]|nr:MAG: hypothetical protein J3K34DRAFT_83333 [Monoraphidium minutum]